MVSVIEWHLLTAARYSLPVVPKDVKNLPFRTKFVLNTNFFRSVACVFYDFNSRLFTEVGCLCFGVRRPLPVRPL